MVLDKLLIKQKPQNRCNEHKIVLNTQHTFFTAVFEIVIHEILIHMVEKTVMNARRRMNFRMDCLRNER